MKASKVRGKNEVRVSTIYPNEVEDMLGSLLGCVVIDYAQVWNNNEEWVFFVRTQSSELASNLRLFLSSVDLDQ